MKVSAFFFGLAKGRNGPELHPSKCLAPNGSGLEAPERAVTLYVTPLREGEITAPITIASLFLNTMFASRHRGFPDLKLGCGRKD